MKLPALDALPITVNSERYHEQYAVRFTELTAFHVRQFTEVFERMAITRANIDPACQSLGINLPEKIIYYRPDSVLASSLKTEQRTQIDETETPGIASFCVALQDEVSKVPINEQLEPMLYLPEFFKEAGLGATYSNIPFHTACGEWAGQPREFWVRQSFADRLRVVGQVLLSVNVALHFEDAFRPVGVQEGLFRRHIAWTAQDHPGWTTEEIVKEARSKTAVKPRLASHKGGAAVDVRLRDLETGKLLDVGHDYPEGGSIVFARSPFITAEQWHNRQILEVAASLANIALYLGEDWHLSYGDNLAGITPAGMLRQGYVAQFGPIKDFNKATGEIIEVYTDEEIDRLFDF